MVKIIIIIIIIMHDETRTSTSTSARASRIWKGRICNLEGRRKGRRTEFQTSFSKRITRC